MLQAILTAAVFLFLAPAYARAEIEWCRCDQGTRHCEEVKENRNTGKYEFSYPFQANHPECRGIRARVSESNYCRCDGSTLVCRFREAPLSQGGFSFSWKDLPNHAYCRIRSAGLFDSAPASSFFEDIPAAAEPGSLADPAL